MSVLDKGRSEWSQQGQGRPRGSGNWNTCRCCTPRPRRGETRHRLGVKVPGPGPGQCAGVGREWPVLYSAASALPSRVHRGSLWTPVGQRLYSLPRVPSRSPARHGRKARGASLHGTRASWGVSVLLNNAVVDQPRWGRLILHWLMLHQPLRGRFGNDCTAASRATPCPPRQVWEQRTDAAPARTVRVGWPGALCAAARSLRTGVDRPPCDCFAWAQAPCGCSSNESGAARRALGLQAARVCLASLLPLLCTAIRAGLICSAAAASPMSMGGWPASSLCAPRALGGGVLQPKRNAPHPTPGPSNDSGGRCRVARHLRVRRQPLCVQHRQAQRRQERARLQRQQRGERGAARAPPTAEQLRHGIQRRPGRRRAGEPRRQLERPRGVQARVGGREEARERRPASGGQRRGAHVAREEQPGRAQRRHGERVGHADVGEEGRRPQAAQQCARPRREAGGPCCRLWCSCCCCCCCCCCGWCCCCGGCCSLPLLMPLLQRLLLLLLLLVLSRRRPQGTPDLSTGAPRLGRRGRAKAARSMSEQHQRDPGGAPTRPRLPTASFRKQSGTIWHSRGRDQGPALARCVGGHEREMWRRKGAARVGSLARGPLAAAPSMRCGGCVRSSRRGQRPPGMCCGGCARSSRRSLGLRGLM